MSSISVAAEECTASGQPHMSRLQIPILLDLINEYSPWFFLCPNVVCFRLGYRI
jgi:hypothetical protein